MKHPLRKLLGPLLIALSVGTWSIVFRYHGAVLFVLALIACLLLGFGLFRTIHDAREPG